MDILRFFVCLNQALVPGQMGQHSQLNLGVVGVHKNAALLGHKDPAYLPSQLHPHGNILEVGLRTAQPSCRRYRLIENSVDSAVCPDVAGQSVCIGGFQLCQLAVVQNFLHYRILGSQLLQHVRSSGISRLRLLSIGKLHLPEQNLPQLLGRVNIKNLPCSLVDFLLQRLNLSPEPLAVSLKLLPLYADSRLLHVEQTVNKRHFNGEKQFLHASLLQLLCKPLSGLPGSIGHVAETLLPGI